MRQSIPAGECVGKSAADLLLPRQLVGFASALRDQHGEWRDVTAYLVRRFGSRVIRHAGKARNLRFRYQEDGLHLHRVSYMPYTNVLAELRMLSYTARVSMCALIVMMLEWEKEAADRRENSVVPMKFTAVWSIMGTGLTVSAFLWTRNTHPPNPA